MYRIQKILQLQNVFSKKNLRGSFGIGLFVSSDTCKDKVAYTRISPDPRKPDHTGSYCCCCCLDTKIQMISRLDFSNSKLVRAAYFSVCMCISDYSVSFLVWNVCFLVWSVPFSPLHCICSGLLPEISLFIATVQIGTCRIIEQSINKRTIGL